MMKTLSIEEVYAVEWGDCLTHILNPSPLSSWVMLYLVASDLGVLRGFCDGLREPFYDKAPRVYCWGGSTFTVEEVNGEFRLRNFASWKKGHGQPVVAL